MRKLHSNSLEDRVVATLRGSGLIRSDRRFFGLGLLAVGALAGSMATYGLDTFQGRPETLAGRPFLLALHSTRAYQAEQLAVESRSAEYGRWARVTKGVTGGAELGRPLASLGPRTSDPSLLSGYFLVRANSGAEAVALARSSPHLRHGGTIIIYPMVE